MATLLLRLAAPMQAWGDESKYDIRGTRTEPTKSGVIGMLAAAMGFPRDSDEIRLMAQKLRMGVRVDQPGKIIHDYHIARMPKYATDGTVQHSADGSVVLDSSYVTHRYYLCDACYLVGIESEDTDYLRKIADALNEPCYPLYLGRRSCPPTQPLSLGISGSSLETAMNDTEWLASDWFKEKFGRIHARIIMETATGKTAAGTVMDQPISFSPIQRKYILRGIERESYVLLGVSEHDPISVL